MEFSPYATRQQQLVLPSLLDYLYQSPPDAAHIWGEWTVERVFGGFNNLIYYASQPCGAFAVKFTRRDQRRRAEREYRALLVLRQAGLALAPVPVALACNRYTDRLVVVQSWREGEVRSEPPQTEAEWELLLDHVLRTHSVRPSHTAVPLETAVPNASHPQAFRHGLYQRVIPLPPGRWRRRLTDLMGALEAQSYADWPAAPPALLHCDANPLNFVRQRSGWLAVDWENSGWGDPAFEVADIMAHAGMMGVPQSRWHWFVTRYGEASGDETAVARIHTYYPMILTMWVAIFSQGMVDLETGAANDRLAPRPADWAQTLPAKYDHYLRLARAAHRMPLPD